MPNTKTKILDYDQKTKQIGHSKYDMGNQNQFSADFGELVPVGLYEVLPDDNWKISENALTLVKPMTAPAFTRIKQNYYGFYVRNSQVWEHWHDFISNGSSFNKVYGNNAQRDAIKNSWEVPQISMIYPQLIAKIANGWAIPAWFGCVNPNDIFPTAQSYNNIRPPQNADPTKMYDISAFMNMYIDICVRRKLNFSNNRSWNWRWAAHFQTYAYTLWYLFDNKLFFYGLGSSFQAQSSQRYGGFADSDLQSLTLNLGETFDDTVTYKKSTLSPIPETFIQNYNMRFISWFTFQDIVNGDDNFTPPFYHVLNQRAFYVGSSNGSTHYNVSNDTYLKCYDFKQNITEPSEISIIGRSLSDLDFGEGVGRGSNFWASQFSNIFWGKSYAFHYGSNEWHIQSRNTCYSGFDVSTSFYWSIPVNYFMDLGDVPNLDGDISNLQTLFDLLPWDLGSSFINSGAVFSGVYDENRLDVPFRPIHSLGTDKAFPDLANFNNFEVKEPIFGSGNVPSFFDGIDIVNIPMPCCNPYTGTDVVNNVLSSSNYAPFLYNNYSKSLGYSSDGLLIYLCKNSCKLLDNMGLPLEGLSARQFGAYGFERLNMLPFFGYSKIWDEYFRNKVVSSPELDYYTTNGNGFIDKLYINWLKGLDHKPDVIPEYFKNLDTFDKYNGWILTLKGKPLNSEVLNKFISDKGPTSIGGFRNYLTGTGNHYSIDTWFDLFSLLTGFGLRENFLSKSFIGIKENLQSNFSLEFYEFSELFDELYYLPNYYNGLLHFKYQNFNKDYFTASMLDPMSGSDEVAIGDTVTSLRRAEIEQSMAEQVAMSRSVKDYYRRIFGVVPFIDDKTPKFLGSDHIDVNIGTVVQTSQTTVDAAQGTRSGLGGAHGSGRLVRVHCDDHGFIIILSSHTVESQYMQNFPKKLQVKDSYLDYPTVNYANIGNEAVLIKEVNFTTPRQYSPDPFFLAATQIYSDSSQAHALPSAHSNSKGILSPQLVASTDFGSTNQDIISNITAGTGTGLNNVFGFVPRYTSYKFEFDQVHGELRKELLYWHSFRRFRSTPILSHDFVNWELLSTDDELDRMFASSSDIDSKFVVNLFLNCTVSRALPFVSVPKSK